MKVWLLDEGTPGHTIQTEGIGKLLSSRESVASTTIRCRLRLRGWKRGLTRWKVGRAQAGRALQFARQLYPGLVIPDVREVDLIVSSCGKSAYLNRLLSREFGARSIFIGELKPFPEDWFDLIITPVEARGPNELQIPVIETGRTPESCKDAAKIFWKGSVPERCWTVLIGGTSRTHPFVEQDWIGLAGGLNTLSEKFGIRWLVSTSRRTGRKAENILKSRLSHEALEEAIWWGDDPKKVVGAFLGAGERIFVTQDSLTMMSEALAVGKRAELLRPASWDMPEESFNGRYVSRLVSEDFVGRHDIAKLPNYQPVGDGKVLLDPLKEEFSRRLLLWLKSGSLEG
ncbi:MAG: ELM1/GtrOC1 family putative glycosyltransferase [Akkermansiaceae bacterium]